MFSCQPKEVDKVQIEPETKIISSKPTIDTTFLKINNQIREDIKNPDLYLERANLYVGKNDLESAKADLDRAYLIDTSSLKPLLAVTDYWLNIGKIGYALSVLEKADRNHPENAEVHIKLSELYLIARNNKKALEYADLAVKFDMFNAKAYYFKGFNFMELGDTNKAISSYQTAVEQDPNYFEAYVELGLVHALRKDHLALVYYDNALEIRPGERNVLYSKGMFQQENGLINEAIQTYYKATQLFPDFREAHFNLGYVHMNYLKINREAVKYFTNAIEVDPKYYQAYFNRGYCFEIMGDINNAEKDYRYALLLKPDYDNAAKGLERVTAEF